MTSILEVEQLDTLSSNASSTLTIGGTNTSNVAFKSGVNFSGITQGITEADQWRLTANIDSNIDPISSNLERVDNTNFGKIGTGMSVSSGLWSFPSTGLWQIDINGMWQVSQDLFGGLYGYVSTDSGSNWEYVVVNTGGMQGTDFIGCNSNCKFFVNVTNISTFRVKFATSSFASTDVRLLGSSIANETHFTFIRLGDSV